MTDTSPIAAPTPASRAGFLPALIALLLACGWLAVHVFVTLDFTDEMQYYNEIASITRTGRFFQGDLFMQQLGYFFLLPLFKLHAVLFPDQSYLVACGRLILVLGYAATGTLVWKISGKLGGFAIAQRVATLAVFVAWVPFQIFSPGYNSLAYLIATALISLALVRRQMAFARYTAAVVPLLAMLAVTYPPAGFAFTALAVVEAGWRGGIRQGITLLVSATAALALVAGLMMAMHGRTLLDDLRVAMEFSRAFGVGEEIMRREQIAGLVALAAATGVFLRHLGVPGSNAPTPTPPLRWLAISALAIAALAVWALAGRKFGGAFAMAASGLLLLTLASVAQRSAGARTGPQPMARAALIGSGALITLLNVREIGGILCVSIFFLLLVLIVFFSEKEETAPLRDLAFAGTFLGAAYSVTSGNGLLNFGLGAAAVVPFLALFAARALGRCAESPAARFASHALVPALAFLLLLNGARQPYRESRDWSQFQPVRGVPAFAGLLTSPTKIEAIRTFQAAMEKDRLADKRLLVLGPHAWLYFVARAEPATPMAFMHFAGKPAVYSLVADRLFQQGKPDAIFITNLVPSPLRDRLAEWTRDPYQVQKIELSDALVRRLYAETNYDFAPEVLLLRRPPAARP